MENIFTRTSALLGENNMERLKKEKIAIFGIGGVGSFTAEALCRSGIESFSLFDNDTVEASNINRQLIALNSTLGRFKTEVMRERMLDINPNAKIKIFNCFYTLDNAADFPLDGYTYIIDAIDTVTSKLCLIENATKLGIKIISCMGTGNKLNPCLLKVADIYETSVCPLAKVMRKELKSRGIDSLKTVFSTELPLKPSVSPLRNAYGRTPPCSVSFVPSAAGLIIASEVIRDILNI